VIDSATGRLGTNIRAAGHDEPVRLSPADLMGLQGSLAWIDDDELVEMRPDTVRLRKDKVFLDRRAGSSVGPHSCA
jgi:GTP-binding protein